MASINQSQNIKKYICVYFFILPTENIFVTLQFIVFMWTTKLGEGWLLKVESASTVKICV